MTMFLLSILRCARVARENFGFRSGGHILKQLGLLEVLGPKNILKLPANAFSLRPLFRQSGKILKIKRMAIHHRKSDGPHLLEILKPWWVIVRGRLAKF
jgi:hypothetical protein